MKSWAVCTGVLVAVAAFASPSFAEVYTVNRSWANGPDTASLSGTVTLPVGNYTIINNAPNPFTAVNLTMVVNGTPYPLDTTQTIVFGTGQFFISATNSTLTFNVANANGSNPADLLFRNSSDSSFWYAIGSNGFPNFQNAILPTFSVLDSVTFPNQFGVVPEPAALGLLAVAALGLIRRRTPGLSVVEG